MSSGHLKTPFNPSLNAVAKGKAAEAIHSTGRSLPCTVSQVISSGIVQVNFEVNAAPFTLPKVIVPISHPEYIRYPIQVGDKGFVVSADARLGGITGLGSGVPDLSRPGNLAALTFVWLGNKAWTAATDPRAVEVYGPNGVILRDTASTTVVTLTPAGIAIKLGGDITINNGAHNVTLTGSGDVIAGTIHLKTHTHSGVTTGAGVTGAPVP